MIDALRRGPDDPRAADAELHPRLCPDGRELHGAWLAERSAIVEASRDGRARLGVLGADQDAVELRHAAWERLPGPERRRVLELPDAERFRLLESIEAGILAERRAGTRAGAERDEPAAFVASTVPSERPWHRPGGGRRRLESTEVG